MGERGNDKATSTHDRSGMRVGVARTAETGKRVDADVGVLFTRKKDQLRIETKYEDERQTYHVDDTRREPCTVSMYNLRMAQSDLQILANLDNQPVLEENVRVVEYFASVVLASPYCSVADKGGSGTLQTNTISKPNMRWKRETRR